MRLRAAEKLGHASVPVHVADLSSEAAKAYRLADNRTNEESSWNPELLAAEIAALTSLDFDLSPDRLRPGRARRLPDATRPGSLRPRPRARSAGGAGDEAR